MYQNLFTTSKKDLFHHHYLIDRSRKKTDWSRSVFAATLVLALMLALGSGAVGQAKAAGVDQGVQKTGGCTAEQGQRFINEGRYKDAIREFTCMIEAQPTEVEGYRGRIEAELLLGRYSDAARDHARVTALVLPVHPDARTTILADYDARLAVTPEDIPALTGASFARWWFFDYPAALHLLGRLLAVRPDDLYGNLFHGSNRLLKGVSIAAGKADLERAIAMAPRSPDVRFIVADAYTYGAPDPERAFEEASRALAWGLNTPRVHAILASSYLAFGDLAAAATHFQKHIELVTTELLPTSPLAVGASLAVALVAGRTYEIPVAAVAGETISIKTSSHDFYDSILVLLAPDGTPVVGSDDANKYFAGFDWIAEETGTYHLRVTSFEGVSAGELAVTRD